MSDYVEFTPPLRFHLKAIWALWKQRLCGLFGGHRWADGWRQVDLRLKRRQCVRCGRYEIAWEPLDGA